MADVHTLKTTYSGTVSKKGTAIRDSKIVSTKRVEVTDVRTLDEGNATSLWFAR